MTILQQSLNNYNSKDPGGGTDRDARPETLSKTHIRPFVIYYEGSSYLQSSRGVICEAKGGGRRNAIKGFSKASRYRLMCMIAKVNRGAALPCFVTLTYPAKFPDVERAKRDLKVFLQRLARMYPVAGWIWKLEPQERGAPHYHLLIWGVSVMELLLWVVKNWFDIAGDGDQMHYLFHMGLLKDSKPCVEQVRSFHGVWFYASKYLGKTFEVAEWGKKWTGRFWGVGKVENIPFGSIVELQISMTKAFEMMRYQRRFMHRRRSYTQSSMITFCDASQWVEKVVLRRY